MAEAQGLHGARKGSSESARGDEGGRADRIVLTLADLAAVSRRVSGTASRLAKIRELAGCLRRLTPDEIPIAIVFLTGETHQGKLGLAYAELHYGASDTPAPQPSLTLKEVDAAFAELATSGKGASAVRAERLAALFSRATTDERDFLARLIVGELRQGALKGLMLEAVSAAAEIPVAEVRRAAMSAGGIAEVARAALAEGVRGLARFSIRLMQPVLPMLAQSADSVDEALERLGTAAFEWKLDGARVQVHKSGDEVRVYTRNLNDVTARVPEIVEVARASPWNALILDGEAIALKPDGSPRSFQVTMRRFGRKLEVEAMRRELPLSVFFFDCLLRDDEALADRPPEERIHALKVSLPATAIVPRIVTADGAAPAGSRSSAPTRSTSSCWPPNGAAGAARAGCLTCTWARAIRPTADTSCLARRSRGSPTMLKGQTEAFLKREARRDGHIVYLKPEIVVEVAFNEVQKSSQYLGGWPCALRA